MRWCLLSAPITAAMALLVLTFAGCQEEEGGLPSVPTGAALQTVDVTPVATPTLPPSAEEASPTTQAPPPTEEATRPASEVTERPPSPTVIPPSDSDGDGVEDASDNCPNDPNKTEPGVCGCGVADADSDSDGIPDCSDGCPSDPNKTEPGTCGCGTPDTDADGDGTSDCNDNCPSDPNNDADGDGVCGDVDNCPLVANPGQADTYGDARGDACEEPPAPAPTNCSPCYPDTCLCPNCGDYDCAGGSGNGPNFVSGPIRVVGCDPFDLDRDNDGWGCE
jgi:hypothetical protein